MAYKTIYDSRRFVRTDSADVTVLLPVAAGGSAADLSATGGANQFVRQSTLGGAFTVGAMVAGDVPDVALTSNVALLNRASQHFTGSPMWFDGPIGIGVAAGGSAQLEVLGGTTSNIKAGQWTPNSGFAGFSLNGFMDLGANFYSAPTQPLIINRQTGYDIDFREHNVSQVVIKATTGNVGIGTAAPTGKFEVVGGPVLFSGTAGDGVVYLSGNSVNGQYAINGNASLILNYYGYAVGGSQFRDLDVMNGKAGSIAFFQGSTGNVGIGTTAPAAKLVVNGGLHVGGNTDPGANNLVVDGVACIGQAIGPFSRLTVGAGTTGTNAEDLGVDSGSGAGGSGSFSLYRNGSIKSLVGVAGGAGLLIAGSVNNDLCIWSQTPIDFSADTGTTMHMRLLTTGRLGIGQGTPTAILHLKAGTATASTAPLKFTAGTLLTIPELGAMEFVDDGTTGHLYITLNVATVLTRKLIV